MELPGVSCVMLAVSFSVIPACRRVEPIPGGVANEGAWHVTVCTRLVGSVKLHDYTASSTPDRPVDQAPPFTCALIRVVSPTDAVEGRVECVLEDEFHAHHPRRGEVRLAREAILGGQPLPFHPVEQLVIPTRYLKGINHLEK